MKDTLEYKILKYLSKNSKDNFIDISDIEPDTDILKSVIVDLKSRQLILTEAYPGTSGKGEYIGYSLSKKPEKCKMLFSGHEYLFNLNKTNTDLELAEKTLKEFPKTKWFARIGFFIAIVLALKELYILLKPQL
jgi:hypothetical protein